MTLSIILWVLLHSQANSKFDWQAIQPIESNCKDVERVFGDTPCGKKSISYERPNEIVTIVFSDKSCDKKWPYEDYAVTRGTVTNILIIPRYQKPSKISDLGIDKSKFQRRSGGDIIDATEYVSSTLGMRFTASSDDRIMELQYFPATKYDQLRCFLSSESQSWHGETIYGASSLQVVAYDPNSSQVTPSLKRVGTKLLEFDASIRTRIAPLAQVYVIAYGSRLSSGDDARRGAENAKRLLITQYNIDADRILTIDGGFKEKPEVQVFIRPPGAAVPRIQPSIHPAEAKQSIN